jgi:hypothetical protein
MPDYAQERKTESRERTNTWAISKNGDRVASAALLIVRGQLRCWFTYFKKRGRDTRQQSRLFVCEQRMLTENEDPDSIAS